MLLCRRLWHTRTKNSRTSWPYTHKKEKNICNVFLWAVCFSLLAIFSFAQWIISKEAEKKINGNWQNACFHNDGSRGKTHSGTAFSSKVGFKLISEWQHWNENGKHMEALWNRILVFCITNSTSGYIPISKITFWLQNVSNFKWWHHIQSLIMQVGFAQQQ